MTPKKAKKKTKKKAKKTAKKSASRKSSGLRLFIADDEVLFRDVLKDRLSLERGVEIVGEAGDGGEAVRLVVKLKPPEISLECLPMRRITPYPPRPGFGIAAPSVWIVTCLSVTRSNSWSEMAGFHVASPLRPCRLDLQIYPRISSFRKRKSNSQALFADQVLHGAKQTCAVWLIRQVRVEATP